MPSHVPWPVRTFVNLDRDCNNYYAHNGLLSKNFSSKYCTFSLSALGIYYALLHFATESLLYSVRSIVFIAG